jgi:hypothetical protein
MFSSKSRDIEPLVTRVGTLITVDLMATWKSMSKFNTDDNMAIINLTAFR